MVEGCLHHQKGRSSDLSWSEVPRWRISHLHEWNADEVGVEKLTPDLEGLEKVEILKEVRPMETTILEPDFLFSETPLILQHLVRSPFATSPA